MSHPDRVDQREPGPRPEDDAARRYGGPSTLQKALVWVVIVAMAVAGIGFLGWSVIFQSSPVVQSRLTFYAVDSEHQARAVITVVRDTEGLAAACTLQAIAEDHTIVGATSIPVTDGPREQSVEVDLRTERRATTVDLIGCVAPGQSRAR